MAQDGSGWLRKPKYNGRNGHVRLSSLNSLNTSVSPVRVDLSKRGSSFTGCARYFAAAMEQIHRSAIEADNRLKSLDTDSKRLDLLPQVIALQLHAARAHCGDGRANASPPLPRTTFRRATSVAGLNANNAAQGYFFGDQPPFISGGCTARARGAAFE